MNFHQSRLPFGSMLAMDGTTTMASSAGRTDSLTPAPHIVSMQISSIHPTYSNQTYPTLINFLGIGGHAMSSPSPKHYKKRAAAEMIAANGGGVGAGDMHPL